MEEDTRYQKAIQRNIDSIFHALWEWKTIEAFEQYVEGKRIYVLGQNFFKIMPVAFFGDMLRNAINVLDKHSDVASFWYILEVGEIKSLEIYSEQKIDSLKDLAGKLKHIRDKVFFHHDKNGVLDTKKIWKEADIVGKDVGEAIQYLFSILKELYEKVMKKQYHSDPDNSIGEDFVKLLNFAAENGFIEVRSENFRGRLRVCG
ncbi:MAG: hypothetical protein Q7K71_04455 [Candidatus Omnitrophota bacterium]|nr:hypothetical protein [Candidatus Omnitrophota bacterium]